MLDSFVILWNKLVYSFTGILAKVLESGDQHVVYYPSKVRTRSGAGDFTYPQWLGFGGGSIGFAINQF